MVVLETHPLMLGAIVSQLSEGGFNVAAETSDRHDAARLVEREQPQLLVVGMDRAEADDRQLFAQQRAVCPDLRIVVYGPDDDRAVDRSIQADVDAYVRKSAPIEDLLVALRQMDQRTIYFRGDAARDTNRSSHKEPELTEREAEVLQLAANGLTTKAMAESLGVTEQTVKFHLGNIYKKLDVANRAQAVRWVLSRQ